MEPPIDPSEEPDYPCPWCGAPTPDDHQSWCSVPGERCRLCLRPLGFDHRRDCPLWDTEEDPGDFARYAWNVVQL